MEKEVAEQPILYFTGIEYYGLTTDDSLNILLGEAFQQVKQGALAGDFSICYLGNPDQEEDSVTVRIGATQAVEVDAIPDGMKTWTLPSRRVVRAIINAYSIVAPNPNKVNEQLQEFASAEGLALDSIYLERYLSEQKILNEIYVE